MSNGLRNKKSDFKAWYAEVLRRAELIDYSRVKGFHVIRPWAYFMWEQVMDYFNKVLRGLGVSNAYFPLVMPKSLLELEKEHVEGFAPELLTATRAGSIEFEEPLYIRPTSEMIIYDSFAKWVRSYRDLPLMINQWCSVVRWEGQTNPFLRPREFLWQEGHCAFADKKSALSNQLRIINEYVKLFKELFALPVIAGEKTVCERFAGADKSFSIESVLPDGRTIQVGTSHYLGQNFSKALNVKFLDESNKEQFVYQTSWGISMRSIGALIITHGDDKGLILPPRIAKYQVVIVPIYSDDNRDVVMGFVNELKKYLRGIRYFIDDSDKSAGWKFNEWELRGVPLRIEVGPRDVSKKGVTVAKRTGGKLFVKLSELNVKELLNSVHDELFNRAKRILDERVRDAKSKKDVYDLINNGFVARANSCGDPAHEAELKEIGAKSANMPFGLKPSGKCVFCDKPAESVVLFSKQY